MLLFAEKKALLTALIISMLCISYFFMCLRKDKDEIQPIESEIGIIEEPSEIEMQKMDKEYCIWKIGTASVVIIALGIYIIPMIL